MTELFLTHSQKEQRYVKLAVTRMQQRGQFMLGFRLFYQSILSNFLIFATTFLKLTKLYIYIYILPTPLVGRQTCAYAFT